jgi:hypothetical protein
MGPLLSFDFQQRLTTLGQQSLVGFGRGIEREALRVKPDGKLSQTLILMLSAVLYVISQLPLILLKAY